MTKLQPISTMKVSNNKPKNHEIISCDLGYTPRRRPTSIISAKSTISDGPTIDEMDEIETEIRSRKCCREPFVFKILKLNSPEIHWVILGCITSILFGAIT